MRSPALTVDWWNNPALLRVAREAAWCRRAQIHAAVIRRPRNGLFVLIRKISGLRRVIADGKAGNWSHPGEAWWRAQLPSLLSLIAKTRAEFRPAV